MDKLIIGKAVKQLMLAKGHTSVFQNIYKTGTRTVKCYRPRTPEAESDLFSSVAMLMKAFNYSNWTIVFTKGSRWGARGFIVKF